MVYSLFIQTPPILVSCEKSIIVFGQGTPPYQLTVIAPNTTAILETIPTQTGGFFEWTVDFDAGANITFVVVDGAKTAAYSRFNVIQPNAGNTLCPKNNYIVQPKTSSTPAILGGVLGSVAAILLILGIFCLRRRARRPKEVLNSSPETDELRSGPHGNGRTGTFNLSSIMFTGRDRDRSEREDAPPVY